MTKKILILDVNGPPPPPPTGAADDDLISAALNIGLKPGLPKQVFEPVPENVGEPCTTPTYTAYGLAVRHGKTYCNSCVVVVDVKNMTKPAGAPPTIDWKLANNVRDDVKAALTVIANKHGLRLDLTTSRTRHSSLEVKVPFVMRVIQTDETGKVLEPGEKEFRWLAKTYGLEPDDFGTAFKSGRYSYRITGIKTSRRKYPISVERVHDNKGYKFTKNQVLRALGRPTVGSGY